MMNLFSDQTVTCFPSGAPSDACSNLTPRHVGTQAKSGHEYTIRANYHKFGHHLPGREGIKGKMILLPKILIDFCIYCSSNRRAAISRLFCDSSRR